MINLGCHNVQSDHADVCSLFSRAT